MTTRRRSHIIYWVCTLLFVAPLTWSAVLYFTEAPKMVATMTHLGYPIYFMKILGTAKVLGVGALLFGGKFPRLKEWAYGGFAFDLLGAAASHLWSGDSIVIAAVPLAFLSLLVVSYLTWHRTDGEAPTAAVRGNLRPAHG